MFVLPNLTPRGLYSHLKSKMTPENTKTLIPKLAKDNYDSWCIRLKAFLGSQECIEIVEYGYDEPESKEAEDALQEAYKQVMKANRKKDNKAKTIIYQGLDEAIFEIIASAETKKKYGRLSNKNTKVLTESRRFISNLCEVNLNYCK